MDIATTLTTLLIVIVVAPFALTGIGIAYLKAFDKPVR